MANPKITHKLSKLTARQIDVLRLVCGGHTYREVGESLVIAESTVKAHMGNIYVKLDLDQLPPPERARVIFELYCPALRAESVSPTPGSEEPEPVPENVRQMVEEDERSMVVWRPAPIVEVPAIDIKPTRQPPRWSWLVIGILLGAAIVVIPALMLRDVLNPANTPVVQVVTVEIPQEVTVEVLVEATVVVNPTTEPSLPTQTAVVIIQEVVVTATSLPTPTEMPITPPDTILEVGDWWKGEGVWVRVNNVEFTQYGDIRPLS